MRTRWATLVAVAVLASAMIAPGTASASTTEAIADTGGMTLTLDVGGSPLGITVTLDEIGHITEVAVGNADPISGEGEHRVRFSHDDDGTRVSVQAKNHKLAADVKAADLADVVGTHEWRAPLFGDVEETIVTFEVVDKGGYPELVVHDVDSDATSVVVGDVEHEVEEGEAESAVKIVFTQDGYTMTLKIQVSMDSDDDDEDPSVKLKIVLRGKDVQNLRRVAIGNLAGKRTWDGHLCDGSAVAITYNISDSGEVTVVGGVGEYEIKTMPHGFVAEFDGSKAKLTVELKEKQDGEWDLKVRSKSTDKCNPSDDKDRGHDDDDVDDDDESEERGRRDKDKKNKDDDDDEEDDD